VTVKCKLTHTHLFNSPLSGTTQISWYQKGKTNLDFTEARDSEWQWHQLGHMQVCTSLQTDNHATTPPLSFLQAGCPSCRPTNSVKCKCKLNSLRYSLSCKCYLLGQIKKETWNQLTQLSWKTITDVWNKQSFCEQLYFLEIYVCINECSTEASVFRWMGSVGGLDIYVCLMSCYCIWSSQLISFQLIIFNATPILLCPFNGLFSRTTWVSRYRKGTTSQDLNEAKVDAVSGCTDIIWTNTASLNFYRPAVDHI